MSKVTSENVILEKENLKDTSANLETVKNNLEGVSKKIEEVKNNFSLEKNIIGKIEGHISDIGEKIETTRQILVKFQDNKKEQDIEIGLLYPQKIYEEFSKKYKEKLDELGILGKIDTNAIKPNLFYLFGFSFIGFFFWLFDELEISELYIGMCQCISIIIFLYWLSNYILELKKDLISSNFIVVIFLAVQLFLGGILKVEVKRCLNVLFMTLIIFSLLNDYFKYFSEKEKNNANSCIKEVFKNLAILPNEHKLDMLINSIKEYDNSSFISKEKIIMIITSFILPIGTFYFNKMEKEDIDKKIEEIKVVLQGISSDEYIILIEIITGIIFIVFYAFICKWCYDKSINRKRDLYINTLKDIQFTLMLREI